MRSRSFWPLVFAVAVPLLAAPKASAAECASSVAPGIPGPTNVVIGIQGFHAAWYGQSGFPTLCPGETSVATVAFLNTGTRGWVRGRPGETAFLGTWGPEPGQDRASPLGGNGTDGGPDTGWVGSARVAVQPSAYVGPGQVAWFQFTVRAPARPGTYRLDMRPLIEGATWMEDFGVSWRITVLETPSSSVPTTTSKPISPTAAAPPSACRDAMLWGDIAVNAVYQALVKIGAGDLAIDANAITSFREARVYQRARTACRAWAVPNGGLSPGSTPAYVCVSAMQAFDDYALTVEEQVELIRTYGGRPPAGTLDATTLKALGQRATRQLTAWLAVGPQCRSASTGPLPAPTPPPGVIAVFGPSGSTSVGRSGQYTAYVWNVYDQRLQLPIVWSLSDTRLGTIDDTGYFEAGGSELCGKVIAQAGDISGSMDVCVVSEAVSAGAATSR